MATSYQKPSRPLARTTLPKSQTKKPTSRPLPSTITNNSKGMKTRVGHNPSRNTMYPTSSILKKKPLTRRYTERSVDHVLHWPEPSDLETVKPRRFYSPIHTPPRLRTLITPPGIEPYRNYQNLRRVRSPLPGLTDWHSAPTQLETWGINPSDYHYSSTLNLMRRYPSPLARYGLGSSFNRPKKPYIVVPRLNSFISPPVSSGGADFTYRSRLLSPIYVPDAQYTYLDRIDSFPSARFYREPSDYVFMRKNEAFANGYVEEFIGKSIEDQLLPDILLEIIGELEQESKSRGGKSHQPTFERHYTDLNQRIRRGETAETHLFSNEWMHELDHQTASAPVFQNSDYSTQTSSRLRYDDLPPDVQGRLLADVNQELIDYNTQRAIADLSTQPSSTRSTHVSVKNDNRHDVETENILERRYNKQRIDQTQYNAMEKYAQNRLLDTICLDELLRNYLRQTGSSVDVDELSQLLDANILGNLVTQYQTIDENRSRTLDNYGAKKFHLNTFMNITMELLLTELSGSLIEDMKDLDIHERKTLSRILLCD